MKSDHTEEHELSILRVALDDPAKDPSATAAQLADCPACLTFTFQTLDDLFALHALAGNARASRVPTGVGSIERLDQLLDDAMVLMAHREPSGTAGAANKAETDEHSVPI